MGWTPSPTGGGALPAGMTFFGRAWSEGTLIRLAHDYERSTRHRRPPASTPPLGARRGAR
jgi:Asp-tRNA(Asn)/Glu-tRNA(Gln) amidotransferase A subunit family amidase